MLSKDLEQSLNDAFRSARAKRHEFMTTHSPPWVFSVYCSVQFFMCSPQGKVK